MTGYKVVVEYASKELSAKEKIAIKDFTNAVSLDDATREHGNVEIAVDFYVKCAVHNEKSEDKDYYKYVIVDKNGNKYVTGSESFMTTLEDIMDDMADAGETDVTILVYRKDSKNYKGKQFITCSIY